MRHQRPYREPRRPAAGSFAPTTGYAFISYKRDDRAYVESLATHLPDAGIPNWYDYRLVGGDIFDAEIDRQITNCSAFLVVLTPAAADSSG